MNTIESGLLQQMKQLDERFALPAVARVVLPDTMLSDSEANAKHDKFGMLMLADNSSGLFYRLLGVKAEQVAHYRQAAKSVEGEPALQVAQLLTHKDEFFCGIGMACINAITHHLYRRAGFNPAQNHPKPAAATTPAGCAPTGMVGYFSQQVDGLLKQNKRVVVLELDEQLHRSTGELLITSDITKLQPCNPIYCTASTLINHTLEGLLLALAQDRHFELIGPTAGCLPDVLFEYGVNTVGGSYVAEPHITKTRIERGEAWSDSVQKYSLERQAYPGFDALLQRSQAKP